MNTATLAQQLRHLPQMTREDAPSFLSQLARHPIFLATYILPQLTHIRTAREPYIAATFGARETTSCLQVFVWHAGATTPIHDHTAWGAYHCVVGSLLEERYLRLDDGIQPDTARLRRHWHRMWRREDGVSNVGAYELGIHRVANPGRQTAISLHMYGPRIGAYDGRDYDPRRDFVCDRRETDATSAALLELFL